LPAFRCHGAGRSKSPSEMPVNITNASSRIVGRAQDVVGETGSVEKSAARVIHPDGQRGTVERGYARLELGTVSFHWVGPLNGAVPEAASRQRLPNFLIGCCKPPMLRAVPFPPPSTIVPRYYKTSRA